MPAKNRLMQLLGRGKGKGKSIGPSEDVAKKFTKGSPKKKKSLFSRKADDRDDD